VSYLARGSTAKRTGPAADEAIGKAATIALEAAICR
jgi:hypothetical protein